MTSPPVRGARLILLLALCAGVVGLAWWTAGRAGTARPSVPSAATTGRLYGNPVQESAPSLLRSAESPGELGVLRSAKNVVDFEGSAAGRALERHRVQVVDGNGVPLSGALVRARYLSRAVEDLAGASQPTRTEDKGTRRADAQGWLEVPLWSGVRVPGVMPELLLRDALGTEPREARVVDPRLAGESGVDLGQHVLGASRRLASGRVEMRNGSRLQGAVVELRLEGDGLPSPHAMAVTDEFGEFEILGAARGRGVLRANVPGCTLVESAVIELGAAPVVLRMRPARGVSGRLLLDDSFAESQARLVLQGNDEAAQQWRFLTRQQDVAQHPEFELLAVNSGAATLVLRLDGTTHVLRRVDVPDVGLLDLGELDLRHELRALHLQLAADVPWSGRPVHLSSIDSTVDGGLQSAAIDYFVFEGRVILDWLVLPTEAFPLRLATDGFLDVELPEGGPAVRAIDLVAASETWLEVRTTQQVLDSPHERAAELLPAGYIEY